MQGLMKNLVISGVLMCLVTFVWAALPFPWIKHKVIYWPLGFSMILLAAILLVAIGLTMFGVIK